MTKNKQNRFWNSFAGKYDRIIERFASGTYSRIVQLIKEELDQDNRLLEIGTGTGLISFAIHDSVKEIHAIDNAGEMIRVAMEKQAEKRIENIHFSVCSAEDLPFPEKTFDTVIASNIFHLLPEPVIVLNEIRRVLKDEGTVIIPTYCHGQTFKTRFLSRLSELSGFKVISRWSTSAFKRFIEDEGFSIRKDIVIHDKFPMQYVTASKR